MTKNNGRIEYIDLMKGICITLVVIVHCNIAFPYEIINNLLQNLRMPLYFFLSGLFFKEYGSFSHFLIKKVNKLVIPYLFFSYIPYIFIDFIINANTNKTIAYYLFMGIEPYNFPLWFLRSLFVAYLLFYALNKVTKKCDWKTVLLFLIIISFFVWKLSYYIPKTGWHFVPENLLTSIFALPFLYTASVLRTKGFLSYSFRPLHLSIIFVVGLLIWLLFVQENVYFITAHYGNVYPFLYLSAGGGIACVWVICYIIKRVFYFSYVGRYSIVVLGTFAPVIRFLNYMGINGTLQALITLAIMPLMIYILIKTFPYFTAQKDLIKV